MDEFNFSMLYRMKNNTSSKEHVIGFFVCVILNRDLFKSNEQVSRFLNLVLNLSLLPYAVRSRTIMCAKASRVLVAANQGQVSDYGARAAVYILEFLELAKKDGRKPIERKNKTSQGALTNLDRWVSGILKKDK